MVKWWCSLPTFCSWLLLLLIRRLSNAVPIPLTKIDPHLAPFENGCLVTFEVMPEEMVTQTLPQLRLTKTAAVSSLNECAFVCYQNFCSVAIFELGQPTSRCHLQIGPREICNHRLQRHYSFRNPSRAIISCVRCSPNKPVTVSRDAELPRELTTPLPPPFRHPTLYQPLPPRAPIFQQQPIAPILPFSGSSTPHLPPAINPFTLDPEKLTAPTPAPIATNLLEPGSQKRKPVFNLTSIDDDTGTDTKEAEKEKEEKSEVKKPKTGGKKKPEIEEEISKKKEKGNKNTFKIEENTEEEKKQNEEEDESKGKKNKEKLEKKAENKKKAEEKESEENEENEQHFAKRNLEKLTEDLQKQDGNKWGIDVGNGTAEAKKERIKAKDGQKTKVKGQLEKEVKDRETETELPRKLFNAVFSLDLLGEEHSRKGWNIGRPIKAQEPAENVTKPTTEPAAESTTDALPTTAAEEATTTTTDSTSTSAKEELTAETLGEGLKKKKNGENVVKRNLEAISRKDLLNEAEKAEKVKSSPAKIPQTEEEHEVRTTEEERTASNATSKISKSGDQKEGLKKREKKTGEKCAEKSASEEENSAEVIANIEKRIKAKSVGETTQTTTTETTESVLAHEAERRDEEEKGRGIFPIDFSASTEKAEQKRKEEEEEEHHTNEAEEQTIDKIKKKQRDEDDKSKTGKDVGSSEVPANEDANSSLGKQKPGKEEKKKKGMEILVNRKIEEATPDQLKEISENEAAGGKKKNGDGERIGLLKAESVVESGTEKTIILEEEKQRKAEEEEENTSEGKKKKTSDSDDDNDDEKEGRKTTITITTINEVESIAKIDNEQTTTDRGTNAATAIPSTIISDSDDTKENIHKHKTDENDEEENGEKTRRETVDEEKKPAKNLKDSKVKKKECDCDEDKNERRLKEVEEKEDKDREEHPEHSEGEKELKKEENKKPEEEDVRRKTAEEEERWAKEHGFMEDGEHEHKEAEEGKEESRKLPEEARETLLPNPEASPEETPRPRRSRAHATKTEHGSNNGSGPAVPLVERSIDSGAGPTKAGGGEGTEVRPVPATIKLENGCFITFQAESLASRPANFTAPFELDLEVESVEICAVRCYQDGCTGALYHAHNKTCVLAYEDKHFCSNGPIISRFRHLAQLKGVNPLWIHCVNCRPEVNRVTGELERGAAKVDRPQLSRPTIGHPQRPSSSFGPITTTISAKTTATATTEEPTKITTKAAATTAETLATSSRAFSQSSSTIETTKDRDSTTAISKTDLSKGFSQHLPASTGATFSRADQSTEKSQITQKSEPTTNKIASSTIPTPIVEPKRSLASSNSSNKLPTHLSQTAATSTESSSPEQLQKLRGDSEPKTIKLDGGCFVTFQAEPRAKRPANHTAPFELSLDVESIEVCAIRCYQDGCTGALYHAHNKTCELSYEDKHFCSNTPIISKFAHLAELRSVSPLWIHCVNCRPEVNRKTGVLDELISKRRQ